MTTVLAVYEGGVLRPVHPLPLAEGETVEVTVTRPKPPAEAPADDWERQIRAAKTIGEWVVLANACPSPDADFDVAKAIDETRRLTGFRLPDQAPGKGAGG